MERGIWWVLVNVSVWAVPNGYVEGHLVGIGEFVGMGSIKRLWRLTVGGHW